MSKYNNNFKLISLIIVVVIVFIITVAFGANKHNSVKINALGVITPMSGPVASMGEGIKNDIELVDSNLVVKYEDDECDPKKAVSAYNNLKLQNVKVFYVGCSGSVLALAPLAKQNNDLIITAYAGSAEIRKTGDEVIRFVPDALTVAESMSEYLSNYKDKKIALFYENQDYAKSLADKLKETLGVKIAIEEKYSSSDNSYKTQILKLKNSTADSLILIPVSDKSAKILFKEMKELGLDKFIVGDVNLCDYSFKPSDFGLSGVCWKAGLNTSGYYSFLKDYKDRFGTDPQYPFYDAITYDSVYILGSIIKSSSNISVDNIKSQIISGQKGKISDYSFTQNGEVIGQKYLNMVQFKP
jgi:branched-chain amino acid transport system substrate-binding protein